MNAFRRLALLFRTSQDFPPPGSKFYVTKTPTKNYVTKSGNSYVTKG